MHQILEDVCLFSKMLLLVHDKVLPVTGRLATISHSKSLDILNTFFSDTKIHSANTHSNKVQQYNHFYIAFHCHLNTCHKQNQKLYCKQQLDHLVLNSLHIFQFYYTCCLYTGNMWKWLNSYCSSDCGI